ncbi:MAG TPA: DUF3078 domain-containing protein [bacterium]|jgi:hypothetical protein
MKKIDFVLILTSICVTGAVRAADSTAAPGAWKKLLEAGLAVTQASYSDNWTGGEVGSLIWAANLHGAAEKQLNPKMRTENDLKLQFGQTHSQSQETKNWASPVKSSDKIRFDTILKFTLQLWVDPYVAGTFESQFLDASDTLKNRYVNPIDLTESAGIARTLYETPSGKATTRLGLGLRQKIRTYTDDPVTGSETTEYLKDGGLEWVTDWQAKLSQTLTYTSKLTLFEALFSSQEDELEAAGKKDYWRTVDANWDNILTANVTKIVQVSLAWQLLYDKEVDLGGRFKETLALGVNWRI